MNRLPWFQFFPADWIKGTRVLSNDQKAAWIDILAYMWESPRRGIIETNWEGLARMIGSDWSKCEPLIKSMVRLGLFDLSENLTEPNENITLTSRRMVRDENTRESNRLRQKKHYNAQPNAQPNANLTDKKSEVRSQKTDKDSISALPQAPRPLTDVQKVVTAFKMLQGYPQDDKAWDALNFARFSAPAKKLLDFVGSWRDAIDCCQDIYERMTAKGFTVTLETITKHAAEWKKDKLEKGGLHGNIPSPVI